MGWSSELNTIAKKTKKKQNPGVAETGEFLWNQGQSRQHSEIFISKQNKKPGEMAQWVKALATKSDNLSSIPSTHTVEEENQFP